MTELSVSITRAFDYLATQIDIPSDVWRSAVKARVFAAYKGGEGSGNFGHAGRPGEVGGSAPNSYNDGKPYLRYGSSNSPMSDWGHAMFADYREGYFDGVAHQNAYQFQPDPNDPRVVRSELLEDKIYRKLRDWRENGVPPAYAYSNLESLVNDSEFDLHEISNSVSPRDIVDSAGIFDNEDLNAFLWNEILEPNGWYAVITPDGAVVYDEDMIKKLDPKSIKAKKMNDLPTISADYHDAITQALTSYFEGGSVTAPRNAFNRAMVEAFGAAFDTGWQDGGGEMPPDEDALAWFNPRVDMEFSNIESLFVQAKELKKDEDADWFAWVTARADGYTRTIIDIYNMGMLLASKNKMLTFDGQDGSPDNICQKNNGTCVKLKGKRHKASWWTSHGLVPYRGNPNYDCGAWECRHFLRDDEGKRFTL